jgi:prephenate dehydrogenase
VASPPGSPVQTVAIFGVGLIGGSFGLALRAAGFTGEILGVSSPTTTAKAVELRAIDAAVTIDEASRRADLIYLSQPIGRIMDTLRHLHPKEGALVTDAGSTKNQIVQTAHEHLRTGQFLGGHPMAGKETRGVESADARLFNGRPYILTPADPVELETPIAQEFMSWLKKIGSQTMILGAEEHDYLVAYSSHLPQLASTALAAMIAEAAPDAATVAGPGLIDATRLALSSYDLWRDILATNPDAVEEALNAMIGKLEHLRDNLRTREMEQQFRTAATFATALRGAGFSRS